MKGQHTQHLTAMKRWKRIKKKRTCKLQKPEPQGLTDEGERIPGIVEEMEKEDQDALIVEQCGDSSDDEDASQC